MIAAFFLTINLGFVGLILSYFFQLKMVLEQRIAAALLIGLIFLGYVFFAAGFVWGMSGGSLALTLITMNGVALVAWRKSSWDRIQEDWSEFRKRYSSRSWQLLAICLLLAIGLFSYLVGGMLSYKEDTYFVQPVHAYGDISLHLGIISSFVYGDNFPAQNPNFAGTPISYPFMVDFLTAIFIQPVGMSYAQSMAFTGGLLFAILIVLMVFFVIDLTNSKKVAILSLWLFLLGGGFGFFYFMDGFTKSGKNILEFLFTLPQDYTAIKDLGYWWINVNLSMLMPQRSFLFGFGTAVLILTIFLSLKEHFQIKSYILVIVLLAILPLIHTHTLVALSPFVLYFLFFIFKQKGNDRIVLFLIGLNGLVVAFLLSRFFLAQSGNLFSLFSWQIGWMSHDESIVRFYLKNFGVVLFVLPAALYFIKKNTLVWQFGVLGLVWFVLPSVMIFQPWDFDNIKLFMYWYFTAAVLSAAFFVNFFSAGHWQKMVVIVGIVLMVLSGGLDVWRILTGSGVSYPIYGMEAIKMADFVKTNTPTDAVFISADKFDNPVVSLAGRKVVMGFSPWLWTYGLNYSSRQQFISNVLAGNLNNNELKKYQAGYIVLFPNVSYTQNQQYFDDHHQLIYNQDGYRIYKLQ